MCERAVENMFDICARGRPCVEFWLTGDNTIGSARKRLMHHTYAVCYTAFEWRKDA